MQREEKEVIIFVKVGFSTSRDRAHVMSRLHRHEEIEFNFVENGSISYLHRGGFVTVPARQMTVFWAAFPHRLVTVRKEPVVHWVNIPLRWFLQSKLPDAFKQAILRGEMIAETDADQTASDLQMLNRWHADLEASSAERQAIVESEIETRLRRLALTGKPVASAPPPKSRQEKFGHVQVDSGHVDKAIEMALFIAENYTQPLRAKEIAGSVDLHPNYATTLFRSMFGMRLRDYLTRQRVAHAQRLVMTTDMKFLDVALASGFGSASRFYAAFRRVCGKTPRHYRQIHRR